MNASLPTTGFEEAAQPFRFTLDDVFKMIEAGIIDEDERVELIGGELVRMSPQNAPHAIAKSFLAKVILRQIGDEANLIIDSTLKLAPEDAPEPDLYLYPPGLKLRDARGADLLLVIEVADSSLRRDLKLKAALYADHGIPEYWVFEIDSRRTHVHRLQDGRYGRPTVEAPTTILMPRLLPQLRLRMADLPPFE